MGPQAIESLRIPLFIRLPIPSINIPEVATWAVDGTDPKWPGVVPPTLVHQLLVVTWVPSPLHHGAQGRRLGDTVLQTTAVLSLPDIMGV